MQDFKGRVAVVTGAASGIGLGLSRMFAQAGMKVALCDVRADELAKAVADAAAFGTRCIGLEVDVSDAEQVETAAARIEAEFGRIDIACNNAGVVAWPRPVADFTLQDWDWILGVNLYGVIHGFQTFVPHMREHGEEAHIVNTASIGGFRIQPGWDTGPYSMSKYAVVGISEALEQDLEGSNIGVSVLAPAAVNTGIFHSGRARPERMGGAFKREESEQFAHLLQEGLPPDLIGERVLRAIRHKEFFIFTHTWARPLIDERHARIQAAFDECEKWYEERGMEPPAR